MSTILRLALLAGLSASIALAADRFPLYWTGMIGEGFSAAAGDVNADGMPDLVFVSAGATPTSPQHVLVRSGSNGTLLHTWLPSLPGFWATGGTQNPTGDLDMDGFDDIARSMVNTTAGTQVVEVRSGYDASVMAIITAPFPPPSVLGISIAGMGDLDGDTSPEVLIVGVHQAAQCRAAYNFEAASFALQYVVSNPQCGSLFGAQVGALDDVDGDGLPDLYIGAPEAYGGFTFGGWIGIYSGASGSLISSLFGNATNQFLGGSLAALSDVTGDGKPELAVLRAGLSPGNDVQLFSLPSFTALYTIPSSSLGAYALLAVNTLGDTDGDGQHDFLIRWTSPMGFGGITAISGPTGTPIGQVLQGYPGYLYPFGGLGDVNGDGLGDFAATPWAPALPLLPPLVPPLGSQSLYSPWYSPMLSGQVAVHVSRNLDLVNAPAVGGTAQFDVVAPRRAGKPFQVVFSKDFDFPGTPLGPFLFPLAMDGLFWATLSLGIGGTLDATGHGAVTVPIPNLPSLQGRVFQAGGIVYDPAGPLGIGCVLTPVPVPIQ